MGKLQPNDDDRVAGLGKRALLLPSVLISLGKSHIALKYRNHNTRDTMRNEHTNNNNNINVRSRRAWIFAKITSSRRLGVRVPDFEDVAGSVEELF